MLLSKEKLSRELQMLTAKEEITAIVKKEYRIGMVNTFEGNVSMRIGDTVLVTPSQIPKESMVPEQVIEMDLEGNVLKALPGIVPSIETNMHLALYRLRGDIKAIVHNHSVYASAFAMTAEGMRSESNFELNYLFGDVPVVPYGRAGTEAVYKEFDKYLGNRHGLLLANHGLVTFGTTLENAFSYAEGIEKIAHTMLIARMLGGEQPLPAGEAAALRQIGSEKRDKEIQMALEQG